MDADVKEPRMKAWDPLELPEGPITRGRIKSFKEALQRLIVNLEQGNQLLEARRKDCTEDCAHLEVHGPYHTDPVHLKSYIRAFTKETSRRSDHTDPEARTKHRPSTDPVLPPCICGI